MIRVTRDLENIHRLAAVGILFRCGLLFSPPEEACAQVEMLDSLGLFDLEDIVQIIGLFKAEPEEPAHDDEL